MTSCLYHFTRTPPGLKGNLEPRSCDLSSKFEITKKARILYDNRKFVFTIPDTHIDKWEESGQLKSLLDMIVKCDWYNYSAERWKIDVTQIDLSQALVRETYFMSPEYLGADDYNLNDEQLKRYDECYQKLINSVVTYSVE